MASTTSLLTLPCELRQVILQYALVQDGSIELQFPVWTGSATFAQSLFQVCRPLRDEALRAFYEVNEFLWIVDVEDTTKSDPAAYPLNACDIAAVYENIRAAREMMDAGAAPPALYQHSQLYTSRSLTSPLPWEYPDLLRHLRHLHVNVYLVQSQLPSSTASSPAAVLEARLSRLVGALDNGSRLSEFHLFVTAKRRSVPVPLTPAERTALEVLAEMKVRGKVLVQFGHTVRAVAASVRSLDLGRRMKA